MQPQRPKSRHEFNVAIFCALPIEADAVISVFDHTWDVDGVYVYKQVRDDLNSYTAGSISGYNVILAHLPGIGPLHASRTASSLRRSVPRIELALVVGICGGVPKTDLFLGDLVVSEAILRWTLSRYHHDKIQRRDDRSDGWAPPSDSLRSTLAKWKGAYTKRSIERRLMSVMQETTFFLQGSKNTIKAPSEHCHHVKTPS